MQRFLLTGATVGLLAVLLSSFSTASQAAAKSDDAVVYAPSQGDQDNACSAHGDNCIETGCCQNKNETCFAKDDEYATCLLTCEKGVHEGDGEGFQTPWTCTTPDLWKCSKENENCAHTACCQNPDLKCYQKNSNFSSCKASCEPGIHGDDDPKFQTPWNCSEVTQACGEVYQQCGGKGWEGTTCCNSGCTCEVTSVYYHQCTRTDVGVGDNDGSANTCSGAPAPPPQTEEEASTEHSAKRPSHASSSEGAPPPLATPHAQVAGERRQTPKKSKASKGAPPPLATPHAQVAGEKSSRASGDDSDGDDADWGDDGDDDWDDMDLAEQLPRGAAAVPAERRAASVAWACGLAGLGAALVLAAAAAAVGGRWRGRRPGELPVVSEEPSSLELE